MEKDEKKYNFYRFEDLRIYRKALDYSKWVSEQTQHFEQNTFQNFLHENFIEASLNIGIYIAEGSARNKSQFIQHLKTAKTYIRKCVVLTTVALDHELFSQEIYDQSREFLIEISKMVGALISSLQRNKRNDSNNTNENETIENENISFDDDFDNNLNL